MSERCSAGRREAAGEEGDGFSFQKPSDVRPSIVMQLWG